MDEDDRPLPASTDRTFGAASLLAGESLDSYSQDELDARIALLEAEIARVEQHRLKAAVHRVEAEALFRPKTS